VAERIGREEVELHGAWFDVERADLHVWSNAERRFAPMDEDMISRALSRRAAASS
jgi:carbonic anhydrase